MKEVLSIAPTTQFQVYLYDVSLADVTRKRTISNTKFSEQSNQERVLSLD